MKRGYRDRRKAKYVNPLDIILIGDEPFAVSRVMDILSSPFRNCKGSCKLGGMIFIDPSQNELYFDDDDYVDILVEPNDKYRPIPTEH